MQDDIAEEIRPNRANVSTWTKSRKKFVCVLAKKI